MARNATKSRPKPRFEGGRFIPSAPVPDPRALKDVKRYEEFLTIPKFVNNPLDTFHSSSYTDPVTQTKLLFGTSFSVINDPELIKHCFVENRQNYKFSAIRQRILRSLIGDGLITSEGDKWRHARHAMAPMFTPRNVKNFAAVMKTTTQREMPLLLETDAVTQIAQPMAALTYLVLSDTLFSGEIDSEKTELLEAVSTALLYVGRPDPLDIMNAPDWLPRFSRRHGLKAVARIRDMIAALLDKRQVAKDNGTILPDDFMTRLMTVGDDGTPPFSDIDIEDHLLAFIGAGHETTARAMSWLFYLLSNDTEARAKCEVEVDALDVDLPPEKWGEHIPYTMACFEETMRLFPPAPFIAREAINDDIFKDVTIPAKGILFINTWQLHRHKTLWDQPEAFIPERFLGENRDKIDRFQYLPFGVGERVCIGQRFAMQEAAILMAMLIRHYRFDYAGGDEVPWPKLRITVQPENGMPMRITRRNKLTLGRAA